MAIGVMGLADTESNDSGEAGNDFGIQPVMPGLVANGGSLPSGFAYIIRSSLRMTELYPLLGEILFGARATKDGDTLSGAGDWESCTNLIAMLIDDERSNLLQALGAEGRDSNRMACNFVYQVLDQKIPGACLPELAFWLDTYGEFPEGGSRSLVFSEHHEGRHERTPPPDWRSDSIIGAGNPMRIYRFFREAGRAEPHGAVNVFLLNSLSNLYRNLGLAETAALLKTMLQDIWKREGGNNGKRVADVDGLFFAVLQEGVMEPAQASYLESFFDGIIVLEPYRYGGLRIPRLRVEALPLKAELPEDRLYLPTWPVDVLRKKGNQDLERLERESGDQVSGVSAQGCFVTTFPVPRVTTPVSDGSASDPAP